MVENLKLKTRWTVWENFAVASPQYQTDEDYKKSINKVFSFNDLNAFASMWNNLAYHKPAQTFFYDPVKKVNKKFEVKDRQEMEQINAINLFRNDITPEWADPENKNGSDYQILLEDSTPEVIDEYWQELVLVIIGETFKHSDQINGLRILDKSRGDLAVRVEIWVKFDKDNDTKLALNFEEALAEFLKANESKIKMSDDLFTICLVASNQPSSIAGPGEAISYLDCFYSAIWIYFLVLFVLFQLGLTLRFYYKYKRNEGVLLKDYLRNKIVSAIDRSIFKYYAKDFRFNLLLYTLLIGGQYIAKPSATLIYVGLKNHLEFQTVVGTGEYVALTIVEVVFASWEIIERLFIVLLLGCKNEILFIKNSHPNVPLDFTIQEHERHIFMRFLVTKTMGCYMALFFSMLPTYLFVKKYLLNRNLTRVIYRFALYGVAMFIALARMKYLFFFQNQMLMLNSRKLQEQSTIAIMKQQLNEIVPTEAFFKKLASDPKAENLSDQKSLREEYRENLIEKLGVALKNNFIQLSKKVELIRGQSTISIPRNPRDNSTITKFLIIYIIIETVTVMLYSISEYIRAQTPDIQNDLPLHQIIIDYVLGVTDLISICFLPWLTKFLIENQYIFGDDPLRLINENSNVLLGRESRGLSLRSISGLTMNVHSDGEAYSRSVSRLEMANGIAESEIS